ncbi:MAG: NUDIX domain-containing protein [Patescibacteria group bacterium]
MTNPYKGKFEVCLRGIIENNGRILVCHSKKKDYYYLPGGHLEYGEKIKDALARELKEELDASLDKFSFIGAVDNIFTEDGENHHEVNLVFKVKLKVNKTKSLEDHIDFAFIDKKEFAKAAFYPIALKKAILKWLKDKKIFLASQY